MLNLAIFVLALVTLYILARIFTQKLFIVLYKLMKGPEGASTLLGWIFLPGTFIHEMSHFITALFLLVPVGKINLMPEHSDGEVKLGSVEVAKSDFFRMALIGIAPLLVGGGIIIWIISFAFSSGNITNPWFMIILVYIIFQITHTMFSSKRDLEAVLELIIFLAVISLTLVFLRIFGPFTFIYTKLLEASPLFQTLSYFLFIPIGLELAFLGFFRKVRIG